MLRRRGDHGSGRYPLHPWRAGRTRGIFSTRTTDRRRGKVAGAIRAMLLALPRFPVDRLVHLGGVLPGNDRVLTERRSWASVTICAARKENVIVGPDPGGTGRLSPPQCVTPDRVGENLGPNMPGLVEFGKRAARRSRAKPVDFFPRKSPVFLRTGQRTQSVSSRSRKTTGRSSWAAWFLGNAPFPPGCKPTENTSIVTSPSCAPQEFYKSKVPALGACPAGKKASGVCNRVIQSTTRRSRTRRLRCKVAKSV